jgi:hypothetical protein
VAQIAGIRQINTKHTNTPCGQKVELLNVNLCYKVLNLCQTQQSVRAVQGNKRCLFSEPQNLKTVAVWAERTIFEC